MTEEEQRRHRLGEAFGNMDRHNLYALGRFLTAFTLYCRDRGLVVREELDALTTEYDARGLVKGDGHD